MEKKIVFIVPYFGKFNNYFPLWLQSCKYNPSIDWLIFTDDHTVYNYPENVKVNYTTFTETVNFYQSKFEFKIFLKNPYWLCEFKMAYGDIYEAWIKEYDFWGFCDVDLIWGNLRKHFSAEILNTYTKISWLGHLTLFANNKKTNQIYKTKVAGIVNYQQALSNPTGHPIAGDEGMINHLFENNSEQIFKGLVFADLKIRSYNFFLLHFPTKHNYKNEAQIFRWNQGTLSRLYVHNQQIITEDFAYIHFLKRPMDLNKNFTVKNNFLIIPNAFINVSDNEITKEFIIEKSKPKFYLSYVLSRISLKYIIEKWKYKQSKKDFLQLNLPINKPFGVTIESDNNN